MTDLKMTSYEGRDIRRGEAFLISDGYEYENIPRYIAVASFNISPSEIDKAQRIADINGLHLADMLQRQTNVLLFPLTEMVCHKDKPTVELLEPETRTSARGVEKDPALERFLEAYAAAKATTGEDAEDDIEDRVARLDHLYRELRVDLE